MALAAEKAGERLSQRLGILDDFIAIDIDQAGMLCVEHYRDKKEELRLNALIMGTSTRVLRAFAGEELGSDGRQPEFVGGSDDGTPVYVDGELRGYGQIIPMSEEEFIKQTVAPSEPPTGDQSSGGRWWATTGTPRIVGGRGSGERIVDFNDPDVV